MRPEEYRPAASRFGLFPRACQNPFPTPGQAGRADISAQIFLVQRVLVTTDLPSWDLQLRSDNQCWHRRPPEGPPCSLSSAVPGNLRYHRERVLEW